MTVTENLQVGMWGCPHRLSDELPRVYDLFPILKERESQSAGTLSGGEQQMLALARAVIRRPRMLLLDEPSIGLAPLMVKQMFSLISTINAGGTAVLLVEQNARMALKIADRAYIMESGTLRGGGPAADLLDDEQLRQAYLGH